MLGAGFLECLLCIDGYGLHDIGLTDIMLLLGLPIYYGGLITYGLAMLIKGMY